MRSFVGDHTQKRRPFVSSLELAGGRNGRDTTSIHTALFGKFGNPASSTRADAAGGGEEKEGHRHESFMNLYDTKMRYRKEKRPDGPVPSGQ